MFRLKTIKSFSIVAIVLSIIGLLFFSIIHFILPSPDGFPLFSFITCTIAWSLSLWAGIIAYKLCHPPYEFTAEEYKHVGMRIYMNIASFILYIFAGIIFGFLFFLIVFFFTWAIKHNYDAGEWD